MALTEKLTAIADAIREKTNTTEKITLAKMPEMISAITGGGGAATEYVNFYDYDGSLLHQYPLPIFEKMAALPMPPNSRKDCECVGWNYDLETIKAMKSHVNVAAIYNQKDEEPDTHTPGEPMTPMERKRNDDRTLTIHWRCGIKTKVSSGVTRDSAHPKHIAELWDAFVLRYPDRYPEITQQVLELEARERGEVG